MNGLLKKEEQSEGEKSFAWGRRVIRKRVLGVVNLFAVHEAFHP